jgi:hypothetical protein
VRMAEKPLDSTVQTARLGILRRIYDWCIDAADKLYALWILGAVSFAESSFFPVPPDIMLLPMSLARPRQAWVFATLCTIASVAGGVLGYAIGALLYDSVGQWLINLYGLGHKVEGFLFRMGRLDHHRQRPDADPLQARDHHLGLCRIQHLAVHRVFDHSPGRPVFHGRGLAQPLRRHDPRLDRETARAVGRTRCYHPRARLCHCISNGLRRPRSLHVAISRFDLPGRPAISSNDEQRTDDRQILQRVH